MAVCCGCGCVSFVVDTSPNLTTATSRHHPIQPYRTVTPRYLVNYLQAYLSRKPRPPIFSPFLPSSFFIITSLARLKGAPRDLRTLAN